MENSNPTKIKIKIGSVEIDYEGAPEFLDEKLMGLIEKILELNKSHQTVMPPQKQNSENFQFAPEKLELSTNSIATKLNVKTTTDLALAACAYLFFVEQKSTFSRENILDAMKKASTYYKENDRKNLSSSLNSLMKNGVVLERTQGNFAIHANKIKELEVTLAS
jgi:hypothetical protein